MTKFAIVTAAYDRGASPRVHGHYRPHGPGMRVGDIQSTRLPI
jgi:hypothetical protein